MNLKKKIIEEESELKGIFNRIIKRDFSGNSGQAVKNSVYQFSTNLVAKFGSLLFTILIAGELISVKLLGFEQPLLSPELFGLYSLALGTILMFSVFADFGVGQIFIKIISKELGLKRLKKAKIVSVYLYKLKFKLTLLASLLLILSSYLIAEFYYSKPILYALLAGGLYLLAINIYGFLDSNFVSQNNFKSIFLKEIIFQISRLILIPLVILYFLSSGTQILIMAIILALSFCLITSALFIIAIFKTPFNYLRLKIEKEKISSKEKKIIHSFILALSITAFSGMFFSYIDMLFLGKFTSGEIIGFYKAAISLVGSAIPLISFSGVLFPIFSRLKGKRANNAFKKTFRLTLLISCAAIIFSFLIAPLLINLVYGSLYESSVLIFRLFILLLITDPLISLYSIFHISQDNPSKVTNSILVSTLFNIIFNITFIIYFLSINANDYSIAIGITLATIFSRFIYLFMLRK